MNIDSSPDTILDQLLRLGNAQSLEQEETVVAAKQWIAAIENTRNFLDNKAHSIVFIGSVGIGKTSLIGVAAHLLVGPTPTDRSSLKNNSVMAIGSGRTTVCEVRVRATLPEEHNGEVGLFIEPFTLDEMRKEIEIFAEDEWRRRRIDAQKGGEDDTDPTSQEIHRAIRGITAYTEYLDSYKDGNLKRRRKIDPLDEVVPLYQTSSLFAEHLLERANLPGRTSTEWWWSTLTTENLKEVKARFEAINQGGESTALLPRRMTVVVPKPLPTAAGNELDLTLIDTRGMDSFVESRVDLQEFLRDPRAVIVLCGSFKDAPGEAMRALLRSMAGDAELREAIPRTLLVLLDHGDADQVNGAAGDREFGQAIKVDECYVSLEGAGLSRMIERSQIIAFDTLQDDQKLLLDAINSRLIQTRQTSEDQLQEQTKNAQQFLYGAADALRPELRRSVDEKLKETMGLHLLTAVPLHDPLAGLYEAIRETRYASVVYATCRRDGAYSRLNLYAAVHAEASRAATMWLDDLLRSINEKLNQLERDPTFSSIQDDIRLRKRLYQEAQFQVIRNYAEQVRDQVQKYLKQDLNIWETCRREWGQGDGFKNKVLSHMESWSRRQQNITAHESTNASKLIPLLGEVSRPAHAPQFTLYIRNIRALRQVIWSPSNPLNVVIGSNGAGKTTLFQILKLLKLAYERGLPEAVTKVLGGSHNLRSWGISEEEVMEIGIDLGEARWRIQLTPREGSVDYLTQEYLDEQGREIFSRDSLGAFTHSGERIEPSPRPKLGLRELMDRGIHEPALRSMAIFFQCIIGFHDLDLWTLRQQGSFTSDDRHLHSRGNNALSLLRRWRQDNVNKHRYQFVFEGLSAAFPNTFADIDFVEAGNTLVARIYHPGQDSPSPLADEANGVLQLLVLFCAVASAEDESVIAIDEPENGLHPYALRAFLRRTSLWAKQHNLTVLLATHSTVLLDELTGHPEQVFVMKPSGAGGTIPTRLDQLCDQSWLEDFKLGDLYEQGELGSNEDEA